MGRNYVLIRDCLMNGSLSYARLRSIPRFRGALANFNAEGVPAVLSGWPIKLWLSWSNFARCASLPLADWPWIRARSVSWRLEESWHRRAGTAAGPQRSVSEFGYRCNLQMPRNP